MTLLRDQILARRDRILAEATRRGTPPLQMLALRLARLEIMLEGIERNAAEDPTAPIVDEQ